MAAIALVRICRRSNILFGTWPILVTATVLSGSVRGSSELRNTEVTKCKFRW